MSLSATSPPVGKNTVFTSEAPRPTVAVKKIQFSLLKPFFQEPFMQGFLADLYLRPSCYQCFYRTGGNCSDLTIGDFWGFNNIAPDLDDDRGTSLVMANTPAGLQALDGLKILTEVTPQQMDIARTYNGGLKHIAIPTPNGPNFSASFPMPGILTNLSRKCCALHTSSGSGVA